MTSSAHPHEEPGLSPMEIIRLQEELQRSTAERAAANEALRESERELERRVEERTRELSTLLNVSHTITTTLELESLLGLILDQLKIVVDYTTASINSLEGNMLQAVATRSRLPFEQGRKIRYPVDEAIDRKVITTRNPILIPDIHADTLSGAAILASYGVYSWNQEQRDFENQLSVLSGYLTSASQAFFDNLGYSLEPVGALLDRLDVLENPEVARPILNKFIERFPEVGAMAVFSAEGVMLINTAVTPGQALPDLRNDPPYWQSIQAAMVNPAPYTIGPPEYGKALKQWRFALRAVLRDDHGHLRFMLQAAIPLEHSTPFFQRQQSPRHPQ